MRMISAICLVFMVSASASAQAPSPFAQRQAAVATQVQAMGKLDPFLGEWLGEGKIEAPGGTMQTIVQMVRVESQLAGQLVTMVDRVQRRAEPMLNPSGAGFATFSYDDKAKRYLFRSYFMDGFTDLDMDVPEVGLFRGVTKEAGVTRRITVDAREKGVWKELSELSRDDGKSWSVVYAITMKRVPGTGKGE